MAGESHDKQRILLVTGMLGAGKSTALRELEDLGWEAIDNFPIRLLSSQPTFAFRKPSRLTLVC